MAFEYIHKGDMLVFENYIPRGEDTFLYVELAGYTSPRSTYHVQRNASYKHTLYVLEYILDGKGYIIYDGQKYAVSKGDFYMLNSTHDHEYFSDKDEPFSKLWINVYGSFMEKNTEAFGFGPITVRSLDVSENFLSIHALLKGRTAYEVSKLTEPLSIELFRLLYKVYADIKNKNEQNDRFLHIKNYVKEHITDGITVEKICAENFISKSTLYRLFKKEMNISPTEYIKKMKIDIACRILKKTNIEMHEIVKQLGFYDYSHFSRTFMAVKNIPPAAYRKKYHDQK